MHLTKTRVPARSYQHYLSGKVPAPLPPEKLLALVKLLRSGDKTVANEIIEGHIGLTMQIVGRYLTVLGSTRKANDLVGEAFLALTEATLNANLENDNITPYLVSKIHSRLSRFIAEDRLVRVPQTTYQRHKGELKPPMILPMDYDPPANGVISEIIFKEMMDSLNSTERKVIEMRMNGSTDSHIAKIVGLSTSGIQRLRHNLKEKLMKHL